MKKMKYYAWAVFSLFLGLSSASAQLIMSVNIWEFVASQVTGTDGVVSAGNWNNVKANVAAGGLILNDGSTATNTALTITQPNGLASFNAAFESSPLRAGIDDYSNTTTATTATFSGLNSDFASGYYAIVYLTGFNSNTGASITDGTSTFYWQTAADPTGWTYTQTEQTSDLGDGNNPVANYAVFGSISSPLTADSITFTLDTLYGGGSGLGGVQLVAVPEPSTIALLFGFVTLAFVLRRRLAK